MAWLLASGPGGGPVRGLHAADLLCHGRILLHSAIPATKGVGGLSIGLRDILLDDGRVGVVGLHAVLGQARDGGGEVADGKARANRRQARKTAAAGHHAGQIESQGGNRGGQDEVDVERRSGGGAGL